MSNFYFYICYWFPFFLAYYFVPDSSVQEVHQNTLARTQEC